MIEYLANVTDSATLIALAAIVIRIEVMRNDIAWIKRSLGGETCLKPQKPTLLKRALTR